MDRAAMAQAVSYRAAAASTVQLAAIAIPASREVGAVLKALRGLLHAHRGVRNVVDLTPLPDQRHNENNTNSNESSDSDRCRGGSAVYMCNEQRWTVAKRDAPAGFESTRSLKALLLDPSTLSPSAVHVPEGVIAFTTLPLAADSAAVTALGLNTGLVDKLNRVAASLTNDKKGNTTPFWIGVTTVKVHLTYENYTMPELLRMVLPSSAETNDGQPRLVAPADGEDSTCGGSADGGLNNAQNSPNELVALSGFEQVGHIAHVNLSKAHSPYRYIVGQVILDCNPTVAVVVNKTDAISSEFREFPMEIIGVRQEEAASVNSGGAHANKSGNGASTFRVRADMSENELLTATVKQHGCLFDVPYNRVYWNSRLSHEHTRLVDMMKDNDVLFDVMAGVGPFAVPAAKRGVLVFGNDLNPASAEYMGINRAKNKVAAASLAVYNWDGRDFMNAVLYDYVMGLRPLPAGRGRKHVVMNLPATAVEFLDVFAPADGSPATPTGAAEEWVALPDGRGRYRRHRWRYRPAGETVAAVDKNVLIHVYCFSPAARPLEAAVEQVEASLGYPLEERNKECVCMVRDVSPQKRMVCVSFTLPDAFWARQTAVTEIASDGGEAEAQEPAAQRPRRD